MDYNTFSAILLITFFPIIILIGYLFNKYGERNRYTETKDKQMIRELKKTKKLDDKLLFEIKDLLRDAKSIDLVETKIKNWKNEGYDVSELEKMLEEVKNE
jgi:hypothetical protein